MRPRTTAGRRALQVALLLGGFLALAFILSGQAHADSPDAVSMPSARAPFGAADAAPRPTPVGDAAQSAAQQFTAGAQQFEAGAQQADRGVKDTVAAATRTVQPVVGLLGTVHDAARQVTSPIAGATGAGHGDLGNPVTSAPTPVGHQAGRPHSSSAAAPATRVSGPLADRFLVAAHGAAPRLAHVAQPRQEQQGPAQLPVPAGHCGYPCEGDGLTHHTGDAHAALFAVGAQFHLGAGVMRPANGSSPTRRSTTVSVQPD
ncbi:hypothetical protein ABZ746_19635 [Streptomyces sp. NPDC020096]